MEKTFVHTKQEHKSKNFLASLLSPSLSKQLARKRNTKPTLSGSSRQNQTTIPEKQESTESIYSSIGDFRPSWSRVVSPELEQEGENLTVGSNDSTLPKVPIYAIVNKVPAEISEVVPGRCSYQKTEKNSKLMERLKELTDENQQMKKQTQDFVNEEKRLHARLQLEMSQLEGETRKEVKCLSERLQILLREKEVLNEQIDLLVQEKKDISLENSALSEQMKGMISPERHNKLISEYRNLLSEVKSQHKEELDNYRQQNEGLEKEKNYLSQELKDTQSTVSSFKKKIETLESSAHKLLQEKAKHLEQIEESKHIEHENQKLFLSLLKITENIALERDVLLNKASFQDNQQKEMHNMVMDYSLNIGRLDEHLLNMGKKALQHLQSLQPSKLCSDENLMAAYNKQLDLFREKILNQNVIISELESEKRKLELQLENIWSNGYYQDNIFLKK